MKIKGIKFKNTRDEYVLDSFVTIILVILGILTLYPLVYVFSMSISGASAVISGQVRLWPIGFSLDSYQKVISFPSFWKSYGNTFIYAFCGSAISVACTVMCGYALSRKNFVLKNFTTIVMLITMLFSGGIVPSFITINRLGLYDTRWAILLPPAVNAWNIIIARVFFQQNIPVSLEESAKIDGANDMMVLFKIVLPLSSTIVAILALFSAVAHWNSFFPAMLYLSNDNLKPVQIVLRDVLFRNSQNAGVGILDQDMTMLAQRMQYMMQIKYVCIILSIIPILILYPLLQRYFVKGIMIGAIKE